MEFETRYPLIFYILSKYRFKFWSVKDIKKYQAKNTKEIARYAVEHSKFFKEQLIQKIKKIFSKYHCIEPEIKIIFCKPLLNKESNKLIRIKCNIGKKNE